MGREYLEVGMEEGRGLTTETNSIKYSHQLPKMNGNFLYYKSVLISLKKIWVSTTANSYVLTPWVNKKKNKQYLSCLANKVTIIWLFKIQEDNRNVKKATNHIIMFCKKN